MIIIFDLNKEIDKKTKIDKVELLKRYVSLLKTTMFSFILSTLLHIAIVAAYYYIFLWMNPDDPGKKKFYATPATSQQNVKIGGRNFGGMGANFGGSARSNQHKSYFLHLVREHYKGMSKMFFVQFSAIYLIILFAFKFFPEREKLRQDTIEAFNLDKKNNSAEDDDANDDVASQMSRHPSVSRSSNKSIKNVLRKRAVAKKRRELFAKGSSETKDGDDEINDDADYTDEEIIEEQTAAPKRTLEAPKEADNHHQPSTDDDIKKFN